MSANATVDVVQATASDSKPKKAKKKSKKPQKPKVNGNATEPNGLPSPTAATAEQDTEDGDIEEPESPFPDEEPQVNVSTVQQSRLPPLTEEQRSPVNGLDAAKAAKPLGSTADDVVTTEKIEAAAQERDRLREEVVELRRSLENLQQQHQEETALVARQLEETKVGKEHAESQYRSLLGKVNTIKAQLGDRLKADAEVLSQTRTRIEELESEKRVTMENNESLMSEVSKLRNEKESQSKEVLDLRSRTNVSQQNWAKERDDLISKEAYAREEFESARQAMQDWEVLAMEERSIREGLDEKVSELEAQLSTKTDEYTMAASERDAQALTVDGLQRALQDIQDARKTELRELVTNSQNQLDELRRQLKEAEDTTSKSQTSLQSIQKELERALPFEKEVKEKNLLIGKLRHEAVILNDHLTKALKFLKKGKPEDNVDRQLVTNHILHFLAFDRADAKKYQVLQLLAALLGWTEEQREQAGLVRPGASSGTLRVPISPFRRTASTISLNRELALDSPTANSPHSKESLAELWSDFLEREAHEGVSSPKATSSQDVGVTNPMSPSSPSPKPT